MSVTLVTDFSQKGYRFCCLDSIIKIKEHAKTNIDYLSYNYDYTK